MNRKEYFSKIITWLAQLQVAIQNSGKLNLTELNIHSENFFRDLLSILYNTKFENANFTDNPNKDTIDLADKKNRVAVQVTADKSLKKIRKTIRNFVKKEYYNQYNTLNIFLIASDRKFNKGTNFREEIKGKLKFSKDKNILTIASLNRLIADANLSVIEKIFKLCEQEFKNTEPSPTIADEVMTIIDLIVYLTSNKIESAPEEKPPDPEGKIYKRFKDYSKQLIAQHNNLITIYKTAKDEAEKTFGLDTARHLTINSFLQSKSNRFLYEAKNDPRKALDNLVGYFTKELSKSGKKYDDSAIRYFLVDELINCNVFPNE